MLCKADTPEYYTINFVFDKGIYILYIYMCSLCRLKVRITHWSEIKL